MTVTRTHRIITIETHKQVLIRSRKKPVFVWCDSCGRETLMLPPEQAAILGGSSKRSIFRRIENGELHFIEGTGGSLLVCFNAVEVLQSD